MKLTSRAIDALQSENGGYSRAVVEALGASWPPIEGWKERLVEAGSEISDADYARLLALKNAHLKGKQASTLPLGFE